MIDKHIPEVEAFFQRALTAHMPPERFRKLQGGTVLMAGVGGGSNVAELLARKGIGHLILADPDVFEEHNIRQRGSTVGSLGVNKVDAMVARLKEVQPHMAVTPVPEGITMENAESLVRLSDVIVDLVDLHALEPKAAVHRAARAQGTWVLTAPSVLNGAMLWAFDPEGTPTFEEFFDYDPAVPLEENARRHIARAIEFFPEEAPRSMYEAAARNERTLPLDAVGVDQASVLLAAGVENVLLERWERIVAVPRGIQVDVSYPEWGFRILDRSAAFRKEAARCAG